MQALLLLFIVIRDFSVYACQKLRYLLTVFCVYIFLLDLPNTLMAGIEGMKFCVD